MKKLLLVTLSIGLFSGLGLSQVNDDDATKECGIGEATIHAQEALEKVFQQHPELRMEHEQMIELVQNSKIEYKNNPEAKVDSIVFVIPVVWHILHEYGSENIADAQVYDAMEVINREWQHEDPDSVDIIPIFKQIAGGAPIEFRLASIDPYGNCTNGIEHIYTHETRVGDNYSKLRQWDRSHYLNIWTVAVIANSGAAAYSQYPEATDGFGFWYDGVISNHTYVGSIGTSSPFRESTITHEIGHWLNLRHVWGDNNDPGVQCGDDGVLDTPITEGHSSGGCSVNYLENAAHCDSLIVENLQNYMDYAYCDKMFTQGQMERAVYAAEGISGHRNILWQDTTLMVTGVNNAIMPQSALTVPLCTPVADFNVTETRICQGTNVTFKDASWNAVIDNWSWEFQDGSPATSTNQNPVVTFNTSGWKTVKLTVSNATGSDTRTMTNYIFVSPDWPNFVGPAQLNIEGNQEWMFVVENPEDNYAKFQAVSGVGYDGSKAFKLNNYKDISNADPFTSEGFYNDRLGKSKDHLVTPSFDLTNTTNVTVGFWYSYASNASQLADIDEVLKVYSSRNCGESWVARKTIQGAALVTGGYAGNQDYTPTTNQMWEYAEFSYSTTSQDNKTRFMFEFEASDLASNLYIDNININGTLSIVDAEISDLELVVYPNPTKGEAINVQYVAQGKAVTFTLRDMAGKVIATEVVETTNGTVNHQLKGTEELPSACYFLEVTSGDHSTTKKIVVL